MGVTRFLSAQRPEARYTRGLQSLRETESSFGWRDAQRCVKGSSRWVLRKKRARWCTLEDRGGCQGMVFPCGAFRRAPRKLKKKLSGERRMKELSVTGETRTPLRYATLPPSNPVPPLLFVSLRREISVSLIAPLFTPALSSSSLHYVAHSLVN